MRATILHESKGRMRVKMDMKNMSMDDADVIQQWFERKDFVNEVRVHERTGCMIIYYSSNRETVINEISNFDFANANETLPEIDHSARKINNEFAEKLVGKVLMKAASTLFFPKPIKIARMCWHMRKFMGRGLRCIFRRQLKVDLLDAISIGLSVARKDFGTAGAVMFLLEIGELLEDWTRKKSINDLARCMSLNVDRVWLHTENGDVLIPILDVKSGDKIVVRLGGIVPVDGIIFEGEVSVNQASLTGESIPVVKKEGGTLYAGTVIEEGECILEVKKVSGESKFDQITKMIENSQQLKSETESHALTLADKLVPYTFAGSILCFALTRNISKVLSVLMVDFSCALKLAMPLAVLSAMQEAGKNHITVKGGKFLEAVAKADTIVLDKTGTLTKACPKVEKVIAFGENDEREMLRLAACLEEHYPHSLANAVVESAKEKGLNHEELHTKVEYQVAHGIASSINGKKVIIGSAHFVFEDEACTIPIGEEYKYEERPEECTHLYLAISGVLSAIICISDPIRPEAPKVFKQLKELGIKEIVMLTGDSYRTAKTVAGQVGADRFMAEVLPSDKADVVKQLKEEGHTVIMVGDGINDSPALSEADAGIAISDGAAIAREVADITISAKDLNELVVLRKIAMGLMKRINFNYRFVIGFNSGLILLGIMGITSPSLSATLHNMSTVGISVKSMSPVLKDE